MATRGEPAEQAAAGGVAGEPRVRLRLLRVALYFPALLIFSLACDAWARVYVTAWSWLHPETHVRRFNAIIRAWGRGSFHLTRVLLGMRTVTVGQVPPGRFIVVSNHQSTADVAVLMDSLAALNCKFVAKRSLGRYMPAVSFALREGGSALIRRSGSREDVARLKAMADGLAAWEGSAIVFAEGTRSRDGSVLPYRSTALSLLTERTGLALLPVAIDGSWVCSDLPGFARRMPGARFRVVIGTPVPPEVYRGRLDETVQELRDWTIRQIEEGRSLGLTPRPLELS